MLKTIRKTPTLCSGARQLQLSWGAELGKAVVGWDIGPLGGPTAPQHPPTTCSYSHAEAGTMVGYEGCTMSSGPTFHVVCMWSAGLRE